MGWHARTAYKSIGVGTVFCIFMNGQVWGQPEPQFADEQPIDIEASQIWTKASVAATGPESAILIMPDGVQFQMTWARDGERRSGISVGQRMYSRDWIVRSQVTPVAKPEPEPE